MPRKEVRATWYNREDLVAVKLSTAGTIQQMAHKDGVPETNEQTTRGLEHKTKAGALARLRALKRAMHSVLVEHQRQLDEEGITNAVKLAAIYKRYTPASRAVAAHRGKEDAKTVEEYLDGPCETGRSVSRKVSRSRSLTKSVAKFFRQPLERRASTEA
jgi:hypothetical protein